MQYLNAQLLLLRPENVRRWKNWAIFGIWTIVSTSMIVQYFYKRWSFHNQFYITVLVSIWTNTKSHYLPLYIIIKENTHSQILHNSILSKVRQIWKSSRSFIALFYCIECTELLLYDVTLVFSMTYLKLHLVLTKNDGEGHVSIPDPHVFVTVRQLFLSIFSYKSA